jgi:hypothetical protein
VRAAVWTQGRGGAGPVRVDRPVGLRRRSLREPRLAPGAFRNRRLHRRPAHWRVVVDLVLLGMFGGFYIVRSTP